MTMKPIKHQGKVIAILTILVATRLAGLADEKETAAGLDDKTPGKASTDTSTAGPPSNNVAKSAKALDAQFRRILQESEDVPKKTDMGGPAVWSVWHRSDLLPSVRAYGIHGGRYPGSVIIDVRNGVVLRGFNAEAMTRIIKDAGVTCDSEKVSRELCRFFAELISAPYSGSAISVEVARKGGAFENTATYTRTTPWTTPGPGPKVAGSKTAKYILKCTLTSAGAFELNSTTIHVLSTNPRSQAKNPKKLSAPRQTQGFIFTVGPGQIKVMDPIWDRDVIPRMRTCMVNATATISYEGKPTTLDNLKRGLFVQLTQNTKGEVTTITAYKMQPKTPQK
jgi:hypothetical protein